VCFYTNVHICEHTRCRLCTYLYIYIYMYMHAYVYRCVCGLLTIFIKIKAHRGDPLNELADKWADEGRQSENIRWSLPTNRPIFSWTGNSIMHRSRMNPTVTTRIHLQVSRQQLQIHTGSTADFLTREDNSRDLLGIFHKDRSVWIRARRRVLQCLSYQFPCVLQLKQWGILNDVQCRLCEKHFKEKKITEPPDSVESMGHIQRYCSVLQLPRNSYPPWHMEGADVLDTKIIHRTE